MLDREHSHHVGAGGLQPKRALCLGPGQQRWNVDLVSNNSRIFCLQFLKGGRLATWRLGSGSAVELFQAYQKIKVVRVSFIWVSRTLGADSEEHATDGIN